MAALHPLISGEAIQHRVRELGAEIQRDYNGKPLVLVCILKGAVLFFADLLRAIDCSVTVDFMRAASYGSGVSRQTEVRLLLDLATEVSGKHVLLVEDIVDSGHTVRFLLDHLRSRHAASVEVCTLLDKWERREADVTAKYVGFRLDRGFVVGYGLDYAEEYRHLPGIHDLDLQG